MLFNSLEFLIFFPIVFIFYFSIPFKYRWLLLLVASYFFYMSWKAEYILLIILSTLVDYTCGILIDKTEKKKIKNIYLALSLISNFSLLIYFKYLNFFLDSASYFLDETYSLGQIILPMGISFYTFQTVSYTIDVYRGNIKAEKNLGIFALYVTFFPQLVAGPIERSENLMPQFKFNHQFSYQNVVSGLLQVIFGFFKKVVIADRLAILVNSIYQNPTAHNGGELIWATYFFAFQIYCDFSAYSDIAIGISRMMGFELMKNFETPYFSVSIGEFWRRWHISLSTWFRDYLYIPLGGNKVSRNRFYLNILIVFVVSGLWHGAAYTFLIWGAIHGFLLVIENKFKTTITRFISPIPLFIRKIWIFHLVCIGWIFFRSASIMDSWTILHKISTSNPIETLLNGGRFIKINENLVSILLISLLLGVEYMAQKQPIHEYILSKNRIYRYAFVYLFLFIILIFGQFNSANTFIYFQF